MCWLLGGWRVAAAGVGGAVLAGAVFGLVWLVSRGGFGFGDVRMSLLIGAPTMATGLACFFWAIVLGSVVTLMWSLADRLVTRRARMVPWAPGYLAGSVLAVALTVPG